MGTLELHPWGWLGISQEYFGSISGNILNVVWWVHAGHMLRSQFKCTQNVIGGYIGGKMIQSPQFTQDVPTDFQVTSPPVYETERDCPDKLGETWSVGDGQRHGQSGKA